MNKSKNVSEEMARVNREVARLKETATEKGVFVFGKFYLEFLRHHRTLQNNSPDLMGSLGTEIKDFEIKGCSGVKFKLKAVEYTFKFSQSSWNGSFGIGRLDLSQGDQLVLRLKALKTNSQDWTFVEGTHDAIEAFRDGDWIKDLWEFISKAAQVTHEEVVRLDQVNQEAQETDEKNRLAILKQNFGLS